MTARARAELTPAKWAELMDPFAKAGKVILTYDEAEKVSDTKVLPPLIKKAAPLLQALREYDEKLSFTRSTVKAGFSLVFEKYSEEWKLHQSNAKQWCDAHTNRTLNICRVVSQALLPGRKRPEWAVSIFGPSTNTSGTEDEPYVYGYDVELRQAFRVLKASKKQQREHSTSLRDPDGGQPTDPVEAVFADGSVHSIPQLCVKDLGNLERKVTSNKHTSVFKSLQCKIAAPGGSCISCHLMLEAGLEHRCDKFALNDLKAEVFFFDSRTRGPTVHCGGVCILSPTRRSS
jgi:hypothetical protein